MLANLGPAPRHTGSGMTVWPGHNWQLIEADDPQAVIGATFGIGLLDEPVSATGTLSLALAALRTELSRPVDLGDGVTFVPEVSVELNTDTATLALRGRVEGISAAWHRLPALFSPETVTPDTVPLRPELFPWPVDLVRRTGHNAAALAWLQTTAADAHSLAAAQLARLDPALGLVPAIFFTTEESLIGLAFPAKHDGGPGHRTRWADGTPACTDSVRAAEPQATSGKGPAANFDDALGTSPTANKLVLLSSMIPRSIDGMVAAELICRQLSAIAINTLGYKDGLQAQWFGAGAACLIVVMSDTPILGDSRKNLLNMAAQRLDLVPDAWLEDAVEASAETTSPRLERERCLMGLPAESPVTAAGVRRALNDAVHQSLHVNFLPDLARLDNVKTADALLQEHGKPLVFKTRVKRTFHGARLQAWEGVPAPSHVSALIVGGHTIRIKGHRAGHGQRPLIADGVATDTALAVLEDQAGTLVIVDAQLRTLTLQPEVFHHAQKLRQAIDARLAGVPRLVFTSNMDPAELRRHLRQQKRARLWPIVGAALVVGGIVALNLANADPAVVERVRMDQTVTLHNGTEITVWGLDAAPGKPASELDRATVQVKFCAGGDTIAKGVPKEIQRSVSADDFEMMDVGAVPPQQVSGPNQLKDGILTKGECATGELTFTAAQLDNPRVGYSNAVGDDVVWYPYGQAPNGK